MPGILQYITPTLLIPIAVIAAIFYFFVYYWRSMAPKRGTLEWIGVTEAAPRRLSFPAKRHRMRKKDALPLILLTAVYAVTAFWNLGSFTNPQSFCRLGQDESVVLSLREETTLSHIMYYPGLNTGKYTLEVSPDGESWLSLWPKTEADGTISSYYWADGTGYGAAPSLSQKYSELFKWLELTPTKSVQVKFLRVTGHPDAGDDVLALGELALYDENGALIGRDRITYADEYAQALFDEQDVIPAAPSWYNSTYFDEIYHPRTALEHIDGMNPYEITHPPLGKLILGLGIRLFGMTPFGWRFMGTLFGVLMLPMLYVFLKNLFGKTSIAACGTALFAFDFMHLTQTRIATIDTYGVFFILAMYFFMYRYLTSPPCKHVGDPLDSDLRAHVGYLNLFLSGLMWGLGAASKWTVIYGAVGLAILYFVGLFLKWRDWPQEENSPRFGPWVVKTLLFSVLCFVVIPAVIYTLSYIPYAMARNDLTLSGTIKVMLENQRYMFTYHEGVTEAHPYSSRWYQWIVDGRPILYYLDSASGAARGLKTAFGAFNNPIVSWAGLLAMGTVAVQAVRRRCGKALFLVVGYLSQLVPWMLIFRTTFAYHYFPSTLFLVLALCYVMNDLAARRAHGWRIAVYGMTGGAVALYAAFYPVLVGLAVPVWYTDNLLRWLPSWPF